MALLTTLPEWATDEAALIVAPDDAKKGLGWTTDTGTEEGTGEVPPLEYFNWLAKTTYDCFNTINTAFGTITAFGTMAVQDADDVNITGGVIDGTTITDGTLNNTVIGGTTPAAATFTKAKDNGVAPTLSNELTNKGYTDGEFVTGTFNGRPSLYVKLPGGFVMQSFFQPGVNGAGVTIGLPAAFPTAVISVMASDEGGERTVGGTPNPAAIATTIKMYTLAPVDSNIWVVGH